MMQLFKRKLSLLAKEIAMDTAVISQGCISCFLKLATRIPHVVLPWLIQKTTHPHKVAEAQDHVTWTGLSLGLTFSK